MTHPPRDIHERMLDKIDERLGALKSGAPDKAADSGSLSSKDVSDELDRLAEDCLQLLAHWKQQDLSGPSRPAPERAGNLNHALTYWGWPHVARDG